MANSDLVSSFDIQEYKKSVSVYKKYTNKLADLYSVLHDFNKREKEIRECPGGFCIICIFLTTWLLYVAGLGLWLGLYLSFFIGTIECVVLSLYLNNYLINLFSFGTFNKTKRLIKDTNQNINEVSLIKDDVYKKINSFEKTVCDEYEDLLLNFFEEHLYKKRSGNQHFEEKISEFSSMIETLRPINTLFVTTQLNLGEYIEYLKKRIVNHELQVLKISSGIKTLSNFVAKISELSEELNLEQLKEIMPPKPKYRFSQKSDFAARISEPLQQSKIEQQKEIISPERKYRVPRKIDNWDAIIKKRKITGLIGEENVVVDQQEFLEAIGRKDLAQRVRHVSVEDGDGLGYDVLSFFENGREKYIEVKSTTVSLTSSFNLSRNELSFLQEHISDAFIYRVLITRDTPQIIAYSATQILENYDFIPVQFLVKAK